METQFTVLFRLRTDKQTREGLYAIYLRITIDGRRFEPASQRFIAKSDWMKKVNIVNPEAIHGKEINEHLQILKHKAYRYQREIMMEGQALTIENFRKKWLGIGERQRMVLEVFAEHNSKVEMLVGKDFADGTLERYVTSLEHTRRFILWKYKLKDFPILQLDYGFITDYEFWLKGVRNCSHNTTMKYLANFKKIVLICVKNQWLPRDPFLGYKMTKREVIRDFLNEEELKKIASKKFYTERLERVRDLFLFSCHTGLAYADVLKLKQNDIKSGIDKRQWIFTLRQKTDTLSRIPLLPFALKLIEKYSKHRDVIGTEKLFPVMTNQKMNGYLKEIADLCEIKKDLTFHVARHTFATTITLNNGVPMETVSKMLGHTNLKTTQHYAKLLDTKISQDMGKLKKKLVDLDL
jgi:site-specific recombinase XerD